LQTKKADKLTENQRKVSRKEINIKPEENQSIITENTERKPQQDNKYTTDPAAFCQMHVSQLHHVHEPHLLNWTAFTLMRLVESYSKWTFVTTCVL
jgi:hypothetical protein